MEKLKSIIKKNIKNLIVEVENPKSSFDIERSPDGTTILLVKGTRKVMYSDNDRKKQIERLTDIDFEDLFKDPNYKNYKNSNNDVYAKSCNDQYSINAFSAFNGNYLESYIQVLNDTSRIPNVFDDNDENIKYWWVSKKLKEKYGDNLKPIHYIGTDYYFLKFKQFFVNYNRATNNNNVYKVEKGLTKKLNNFSTGEIIKQGFKDASVTRPSFLISDEDEITLPDGKKISAELVMGGWMDWSITKNSWCEITGSLLQYKQTKIQLLRMYYTPHIREFEINYNTFKDSLPINLEKMWNENNGVIKFYPCFSRKSLDDGSLLESFNGYYDQIQESTIESILSDSNCVGNQYPTTAELMSRGEFLVTDENQNITNMSQSIVEIPLFNVSTNPKEAKKPTNKRKERGQSWQAKTTLTFTTFIQYIGTGGVYPLMTLDDKAKKWTGENPMFYQEKEKSLFKTPMNEFFKKTKKGIKPEDLLDHIELAEDSVYWTIDSRNFSSKIPGVKSKSTPTGIKYYIDYDTNNLRGQVYLPDDDWWSQYNGFIYKFVNTVTSSGMATEEKKTFGLILQIYGAENFKLNQETYGRAGWSLKVDQSMQMYYSQDNIPIDDLGYKYENKKINSYGVPGVTIPYNSYSTEMMDTRSSMEAFFQSKISILVTIAAGIGISLIAPMLAPLIGEALGIGIASEGAFVVNAAYQGTTIGSMFTANMIYNRTIAAVLTECLLSAAFIDIPFAFTLFQDGDYLGGTLSAMCMWIPFVTELKSFSAWSRSVDKSAFKSLGIKLSQLPPFYFEKFNVQRFTEFVNNLNKSEAVAFGQLLDGITAGGGKADLKMFQEFYEKIGKEAKRKWEYYLKFTNKHAIPLPKLMQESLDQMSTSIGVKIGTFIKPLVAVGGGAALPQTAWSFFQAFNKKERKLTKQQLEIVKVNLQKWHENLAEKDLTISNDIKLAIIKLKNENINIEDLDFDKWFNDLLNTPEGSELFENMIKINGYEFLLTKGIMANLNNDRTKNIKGQVNPIELIQILMNEEMDNLTLNNMISDAYNSELVSSIINGLDKNKESVIEKINVIKDRFPCVEEDQEKFKFLGTLKSERSGNSWAIFYENSELNRLSRNILVFAGNGNKLGIYGDNVIFGWDTNNGGTYTSDNIIDYFNSIYPNCENFKIKSPEDSEYEYKKLKDGKLFKRKKSSEFWVEIKNTEEINKVTDNFFKK
jgi:hypothetical protein